MPKLLSIVDFDLSLSRIHTFRGRQITMFPKEIRSDAAALIKVGSAEAQINLKDGLIGNKLFSMEGDNVLAIATYHNNPDFIAGYLQVVLGKTVTPSDEAIKYSGEPKVAIKSYIVDGKQLSICYIPETGKAFEKRIAELHGKNEQINFLKATLGISEGDFVKFYDDDSINTDCAQSLEGVETFLVNRDNASFEFIKAPKPSMAESAIVPRAAAGAGGAGAAAPTPAAAKLKEETIQAGFATLRSTGLVHPNTLTANAAAWLAKITNKVILRESTNNDGEILITRPDGIHAFARAEINENPAGYANTLMARSTLQTLGGVVTQEQTDAIMDKAVKDAISFIRENPKLVHPSMSRDLAETLADTTNRIILRESVTLPGMIAITLPNDKQHYLFQNIVRDNPARFPNLEVALAGIQKSCERVINTPAGQTQVKYEVATTDDTSPIEKEAAIIVGLKTLHRSGYVHPVIPDWKIAMSAARSTGKAVLRQSSDKPGEIVVSTPDGKQFFARLAVAENPGAFGTNPAEALKALSTRIKFSIATVAEITAASISEVAAAASAPPSAAAAAAAAAAPPASDVIKAGVQYLRGTGLAHAKDAYSPEAFSWLAKQTNCLILRESRTEAGAIAISHPNGEKYLAETYVKDNPAGYASPALAQETLSRRSGLAIATLSQTKAAIDEAVGIAIFGLKIIPEYLHPKTLSREEAEKLAKATGKIILRESTSQPGMIAITRPDGHNLLLQEQITLNPSGYACPNDLLATIKERFGYELATKDELAAAAAAEASAGVGAAGAGGVSAAAAPQTLFAAQRAAKEELKSSKAVDETLSLRPGKPSS